MAQHREVIEEYTRGHSVSATYTSVQRGGDSAETADLRRASVVRAEARRVDTHISFRVPSVLFTPLKCAAAEIRLLSNFDADRRAA